MSDAKKTIRVLRSELAAVEQLLNVHEQVALEQATRLEDALALEARAREELSRHHEQLERLVAERTSELTASNELLKREIGDRRDAEEARERSEERFRSLAQASTDAILTADARGNIMSWSPGAEKMFGHSEADAVGAPLGLVVPDHAAAGLQPAIDQLTQGAKPKLTGKAVELCGRRRDGSEFPIELSLARWQSRGDWRYGAIIRDITDRRAANEELARFHDLLEATSDFVAIADAQHRVLYVNRAGRQMTGYGEQEDLSTTLMAAFHSEEALEILNAVAFPAAGRDDVWTGETTFLCRDGHEFPASMVLVAHKSDTGTVEFVSTICRDLTEQKRLDGQLRQRQKLDAVGSLAAGVAHDFNNILAVILTYADLVGSDLEDPELREDIEEIITAAQRGASLTRQLLAFSRKQTFEAMALNLNTIVDGMIPMLRRLVGEDIELRTELAEALSPVRVDPSLVDQVLMNLVVNARDAMPVGGRVVVKTEARARSGAEAKSVVVMSVVDDGCGMDEDTSSKMFDPFFTTKGRDQGTGLGLSVVYGIVKQSSGELVVRSALGAGTTIEVHFPATSEPESTRSAPAPHIEAPCPAEITILLVEDERSVRTAARRVLEADGYRVLATGDGREALELVSRYEGNIDLVVSDVVMPGISGPELVARLSKHLPRSRTLFITGYDDNKLESYGVKGARAVLLKPFDRNTLLRGVANALAG